VIALASLATGFWFGVREGQYFVFSGLNSSDECTSKTETYDGNTVALETCTAIVDDVVAANAEGYRFIAYVVKWKGQRIVVSDPSSDSNLAVGDRVSFTVMKFPALNDTSMPMTKYLMVFAYGEAPKSERRK